MLNELNTKGKKAKEASYFLSKLSSAKKNLALEKSAEMLLNRSNEIIESNKKDVENARVNHVKAALLDRLILNEQRIASMSEGLVQIAGLDDPVGEVLNMKRLPNGLTLGQRRVPMGVIGIIYESRPNVTVDAFGLCLKTGNATILRGGKEAFFSNVKIIRLLQEAL